MTYKVILLETARQKKSIEKFIKSLSPATTAKLIHSIDLLEKYGPILRLPHSKKIRSNLYELRIRGKEEVRIFYTIAKRKIYLLHAIKKKRQKIPKREISIALERLKKLI